MYNLTQQRYGRCINDSKRSIGHWRLLWEGDKTWPCIKTSIHTSVISKVKSIEYVLRNTHEGWIQISIRRGAYFQVGLLRLRMESETHFTSNSAANSANSMSQTFMYVVQCTQIMISTLSIFLHIYLDKILQKSNCWQHCHG